MIKKSLYTICLSFCLAFTTSCESDLLTQVNPNAVTDGSFWQTESDFDKAVNALYGSLQLQCVSGKYLVYDMCRSDLGGTESWYGNQATFTQLKWDDTTTYVEDRWSELYVGIYRANQILYYIEDATCFDENPEQAELIIAQAKFLRGYCYFWLAYTYNGAVIHDVLATTPDDMHKPFSSKEEVISTMVIPDLEAAAEVLPTTWDQAGHFTWGAATAMLGKTYLYQNDWAKAKEYFGQIIVEAESNGLYSLVPNFMDNFTVDNEYNSESILEVAYSDNYKEGTNAQNHDESNGSEANSIALDFASLYAGGYNDVLPTYHCQEMFVSAEEMDPTNSWTSSHERSIRTYATIVVEYGDGDYYGSPLTPYTDDEGNAVTAKTNFNYGQSSKVKKWTQWDRIAAEDSSLGARTGINYRAIRYADVLLMYAEACLECGDAVSSVIPYIDQVRKRAGVITLQQYMSDNSNKIPQLHISKYANSWADYNYVDANTENVLTHIRQVERVLELAFEGHRWYDLVRWGIAKEVFDQCWQEEQGLRLILCGGIDSNTIPTTATKEYPLYVNERIRPDFQNKSENYVESSHNYFPIPSYEKVNNNAL
ncbi:MAG: RagB/SusD family nutrient uptake outer membrane protein [Rikenellaceae bacterium]